MLCVIILLVPMFTSYGTLINLDIHYMKSVSNSDRVWSVFSGNHNFHGVHVCIEN